MAFDYSEPIRNDIPEAHRHAWSVIAAPGRWWTGAERVAIASEVRRARDCALCAERKAAVSPFAVDGTHDSDSVLPDPAIDAVHRLATDAARLTRSWLEKHEAAGLSDGHYVELLGVVVAVVSVDEFHYSMGLPLEPLPAPEPGEPTHVRPEGLVPDVAWVPMLDAANTAEPESDLFPGGRTGNVIRAMSLVPEAVRLLKTLSKAHYVPIATVGNPASNHGRALSRSQIELIAGRVSAMNECFY
jgi:hypothetical protein